MSYSAKSGADAARGAPRPEALVNALPHPVLAVDASDTVVAANAAAETFFQVSVAVLQRHGLDAIIPFGSPLFEVMRAVRERAAAVSEYRVAIGTPRTGGERLVDIYVSPLVEDPQVLVIMLHERTIAEKFDRQLTHRASVRSVVGLASMLAHEIKNPLSGIRGAAQLLESTIDDNDRPLATLIREETDRIVKLVDRMEVFSDRRPVERAAINIHVVLDRVKRLAQNGFARNMRFVEEYDPSLPPVFANQDQLVQVFLNLVKNAAEAVQSSGEPDGEIILSTAFRPGVRMSIPGSSERVSLPLEFCVKDNGPGVSEDLLPHLFDPFVTTKPTGSGLGLALVAKIVGDNGGVIECDSRPRRTTFRILMPMYTGEPEGSASQGKA
ncbi:two-component system sensor histidine kinase NtrB [Lutibaculum baratangense]|uniref:histidine kinase n=1 Tax=Lutibaculum baratangense AMV1 TaxID=631454 RepID=V4RVZ2_9HYPH|nr:ATP-binding protein [Lutibaculum baratangense]ESR27205.1 Nitrogen regulation protein NR(II) [Lutibaculum baratangense AMV1]